MLIEQALVVYQLDYLIEWLAGNIARSRQQMSALPDATGAQGLLQIVAIAYCDQFKEWRGVHPVHIGCRWPYLVPEGGAPPRWRRDFFHGRRQRSLSLFIRNQAVAEFLDIAPLFTLESIPFCQFDGQDRK